MLYYTTVNTRLRESLDILMKAPVLKPFRLVGGTALSLQLGHRLSVDIDLFTDAGYGHIDFKAIDVFMENTFPYFRHFSNFNPAIGKSYAIGTTKDETVKVDIFYTDAFIQPDLVVDDIRMATVEEIIAMKVDVIQRGGRKKDFWDLHELLLRYDIHSMLLLHQQRYPYTHDRQQILTNLTDFTHADNDFDPVCLRGKFWEFIKEDMVEIMEKY